MNETYFNLLAKSVLFRGMSVEEIAQFIRHSGSFVSTYQKNEIIFDMHEKPEYLFVLLKGSITVNKDSLSGKRTVVSTIDDVGNIFAEVYLFLPNESYDYYTLATGTPTEVLKIPKAAFLDLSEGHQTIVGNMLLILSQKAYNFARKLQVLSSGTLRQKLAKLLLESLGADNRVALALNREQLAEYLNVARPSLSRELGSMAAEGLIRVNGKTIVVPDPELLEDLL